MILRRPTGRGRAAARGGLTKIRDPRGWPQQCAAGQGFLVPDLCRDSKFNVRRSEPGKVFFVWSACGLPGDITLMSSASPDVSAFDEEFEHSCIQPSEGLMEKCHPQHHSINPQAISHSYPVNN